MEIKLGLELNDFNDSKENLTKECELNSFVLVHASSAKVFEQVKTVREVFIEQNSPTGVILQMNNLESELQVAINLKPNFICHAFKDEEQIQNLRKKMNPYVKLIGFNCIDENLINYLDGVYFTDKDLCDQFHLTLKRKAKFILVNFLDFSYAVDGCISNQASLKSLNINERSFYSLVEGENEEDVISSSCFEIGKKVGAKAIIAFTSDGKNIEKLSRHYCDIPLIAVANRKIYEPLLLSLICNYSVRPTAITSIPLDDETIDFAKFIGHLYGYKDNEFIIVTGHYNASIHETYVRIVKMDDGYKKYLKK